MHVDLCRPMSVDSLGGMLPLLGFDDDYTLYKQMYFRDCMQVSISGLVKNR